MEKRKLFLFVFIVMLIVASISVFTSQTSGKSAYKTGFTFAQDTVDIGILQLDSGKKEVPLAIYNYEDTALQVQDIVSSCGCVLTETKNFSIAHNDSSIIRTTIQARKGDAKGIVHRTIAVRTNYINPIKYVVIKAQIT